ncbi:chemotaxis response regulator protein-glutamate methylesterase [Kineothrix sedimenti]|uniref:Protein-glutamate methylesterase/protein-glutamine glutaminase n=1 Tax=Kineothrix sedimenti TaxID=3123317 RepID=A0ABZ3EY78_9FIRM
MKKKIRVLVVDDSIVFREAIIRGIETDVNIEVVARASDPFEARDKILEWEPDVMTCDIEMPRMNGIEFVRRLLPQYSIPVIIVSGLSEAVFDAMDAGAVDFVAKPVDKASSNMQVFIRELIAKIKIAAVSKVAFHNAVIAKQTLYGNHFPENRIIAMGASTGGTEALYSILMQLPADIPGIVIVQHIPPVFSRMFSERLNNQTSLTVKEAEDGDYVEKGKVLIAPGDRHMRINKLGDRYKVEVSEGEKVSGHCPSVDMLFDSAAKKAGNEAIGIILTGMGYDGAKGLLAMKRKGARTIGQDEKSCVVYGMPKAAYDIGAVETQVPLSGIPRALMSMLK